MEEGILLEAFLCVELYKGKAISVTGRGDAEICLL
jgi:hypothetical protein